MVSLEEGAKTKETSLPQFLTRQSNLQQQPQAAQLPFSQFGGNRPPLQGDTAGGIAFPDAGQPQPGTATANPFLLPTGLSNDELDALLGGRLGSRQEISGLDPQGFSPLNRLSQSVQQTISQTLQNRSPATGSTLPTGGIPIEGSGGFDKFNPIGAGGLPFPSPGLSATNLPSQPNPALLEQNKLGGFFLGG